MLIGALIVNPSSWLDQHSAPLGAWVGVFWHVGRCSHTHSTNFPHSTGSVSRARPGLSASIVGAFRPRLKSVMNAETKAECSCNWAKALCCGALISIFGCMPTGGELTKTDAAPTGDGGATGAGGAGGEGAGSGGAGSGGQTSSSNSDGTGGHGSGGRAAGGSTESGGTSGSGGSAKGGSSGPGGNRDAGMDSRAAMVFGRDSATDVHDGAATKQDTVTIKRDAALLYRDAPPGRDATTARQDAVVGRDVSLFGL